MMFLFVGGLCLLVAGVALFDVRAGVALAGLVLVLVSLFWDGEQ